MNSLTITVLLSLALVLVGLLFLNPSTKRRFSGLWYKERTLREDTLKRIYGIELSGLPVESQELANLTHSSLVRIDRCLAGLKMEGLLSESGGVISLTSSGMAVALRILRAHRLVERYLADETGFDELEWHTRADKAEHELSIQEVEALSRTLRDPAYDPHGDPIPSALGEVLATSTRSLVDLAPGCAGRIVHLEDEPAEIYGRLLEHGLVPGMEIYVIDQSDGQIIVWADGARFTLELREAENVSFVPIARWNLEDHLSEEGLSDLERGAVAVVTSISPRIRGQERRRLMDLGVVPGTQIQVEYSSPSGDPVAYLVRGSLLALRREQSRGIRVHRLKEDQHDFNAE